MRRPKSCDGRLTARLSGNAAKAYAFRNPFVDATADYLAEFDVFGPWLETRCEQGAGFRASAGELWKSWSTYARTSQTEVGSRNDFSDALQGKGFVLKRGTGGARHYHGLRLRLGQ